MTTKKILLIVGGVVAAFGLVAAILVGGAVWSALTIGKSEAAQTAKAFLRQNGQLRNDIGDVRDFGFWMEGNINSQNSDGEAMLRLEVIGAKKIVFTRVNLTYRNGREWAVVGASYRNDAGRIIELIDLHESESMGVFLGHDRNIELLEQGNLEDKLLHEKKPVLVTFSDALNEKTSMFMPALLQVSGTYSPQVRFYLINVYARPSLAEQYKVQKAPTLVMFKDGQERERIVGSRSGEEISQMLEKQLKK